MGRRTWICSVAASCGLPPRSPPRLPACQRQSPLREKPRSRSQVHDQRRRIALTPAVASRRRGPRPARGLGSLIWCRPRAGNGCVSSTHDLLTRGSIRFTWYFSFNYYQNLPRTRYLALSVPTQVHTADACGVLHSGQRCETHSLVSTSARPHAFRSRQGGITIALFSGAAPACQESSP